MHELIMFGMIIFLISVAILGILGIIQEFKELPTKKDEIDRKEFYKKCKYPNEIKLNDCLFEKGKNITVTRNSSFNSCGWNDGIYSGVSSNLDYLYYTNAENNKFKFVSFDGDIKCDGFKKNLIKQIYVITDNTDFLIYDRFEQKYVNGPWDNDIDILINDGYKNKLNQRISELYHNINERNLREAKTQDKNMKIEIEKQHTIKYYKDHKC